VVYTSFSRGLNKPIHQHQASRCGGAQGRGRGFTNDGGQVGLVVLACLCM